MNTHFSKYETEQAYNSDLDKLVAPNVSLLSSTNEVKYKKSTISSVEPTPEPEVPEEPEEDLQLWETFEIVEINGHATPEHVIKYEEAENYRAAGDKEYKVKIFDADGTVAGKLEWTILFRVKTKYYDKLDNIKKLIDDINNWIPNWSEHYIWASNPAYSCFATGTSISTQQDITTINFSTKFTLSNPSTGFNLALPPLLYNPTPNIDKDSLVNASLRFTTK